METKMKKAQLEAELKKAQKRISMLEAKASTQNNDDRYYSLFEESPFSLWEEDFSEVKIKLDQLKEGGVTDLRGYLNAHPEFVAECASLVKVLDVNKATLQLFEVESKEELVQNLGQIINQESIQVFTDELIAFDSGQTIYFWEGINHTPSGEEIEVEILISILPGCEETLSRVIVSMLDVTQRKKAEKAHRHTEIYYRALFEQTHDAVFIVDLEGRHLAANQRAADILGYKTHELLGLPVSVTSTQPEDSQKVVQRLLNGEIIPIYERVFRKKDGSHLLGEVNVELVRDVDGKPLHIQSVVREITERKQVETALKKSEAQYRLLADHMSDIVWLMDMELNIVYVSPSTTKLQGFTLEELRALPLEKQLTAESYTRAINLYMEGIATANLSRPTPNITEDIDLEFYKKDGTTYWSRNTLKLILDENGQPVNILGIGHDITNKRIAEKALGMSEERYRSITEDMPVLISRFLADGTITFVNSFYCHYFKTPYEELVGSNLFRLLPEQERDFVRNKYLSLDKDNPYITYEYKAFDGNGRDCWQRWTDRALFNEQGEVIEYQSIGEDITERKTAEKQLEESEARFRALLANTGDLIIVIDAEGNITFASPSSERIFGYKPEESLATNFTDWVHPDDLAEVAAAFQSRKQIVGVAPQSIQARGLHKDGSWRYVEALGTNLLEDPAIKGIVLNIRDVTEQKRADMEKQALYEILQGMTLSQNLGEFLSLVHYSIERILQARNLFVSLYNPNTGLYEDVYCVDEYDEPLGPSSREGTLTSYIFRTGNPMLITEEKFNELVAAGEVTLIGADSKSWIGVPLKTAGKTIGVMVIQDYEIENLYSEKELAFLASISGQVASAVERKQAEERLHESETRFATAYENAPLGMALVEISGLLFKVNQAFCNLLGYKEEELTSKTFQEITHADDLETDLSYLKQLVDGKINSYQMEKRYRHKRGHYVWGALSVSLVRSDDNTPLYFISQIQDITETRNAEEALRQAEEKYRTIFENSLEGIFQSTPAGRFITVNPALARMWGYDSPEDMVTSVTDIGHQIYTDPAIREEHTRLLREHGGNLTGFEYQAYCKDGSTIWVSENVHSIEGEDGVVLYEGTVENISSRKQAEDTLKESEKRYRLLFNTMLDGFALHKIICDENGKPIDYRFLEVNPAFEKFTGLKSSEVIGKTALEVMPGTEAYWIETYGKVALLNQSIRFENYSRDLGKYYDVVAFSPEKNQFAIFFNDITERKKAEAEISRQLSELETLYESGLAISRLLTPKEIAQKVIEILDRRMNWHHIAIRQYYPEDNSVKMIAFNRPDITAEQTEEYMAKMNEIISHPGQGLSGWVITHRKSVRVPNVINDKRYIDIFPGIQSGLYVPIMIGDRIMGSIAVESDKENGFTEGDERMLETLAVQAAIAIENANLFATNKKEIVERQNAEAALQYQAGKLIQLNNELEQHVLERTAEIEDTRKRLQLAADAAGLGIWEWDNVNGRLIWDAQMYRIYGVSPEKFGGKLENIYEYIIPEDQHIMSEAAYNIVVNLSTNYQIEYRILRKDGEICTLAQQGVAIFDENNILVRVIGTVNDITQQKKAEQALRESEAYARLLFESAPDPVSVGDVEGKILDVNKLFEIQHHVKREEIRGRHLSELSIFPADELEKIKKYLEDVAQGKDDFVEINFNTPGGGGTHTLEMSAFPIEVQGNQLILSTTRDITLHKKAEESLRASNNEMERALRMKDEFLANMSHELRTPLNAILGMSESLEEQIAGPLNEKQLKYIRTIGESGKHLLELINDILDLSKIEAGRLDLSITQITVSSMCEASMRMVREQAQKKNQNLFLKIDPEIKTIMGDERRLKQALVNLLSNAVKFTPNERQVGLDVKGNFRNQTVTFTVWDEGIGIASEELNLIFKPFVQLDSGLSREFSGTGLGLVLVAQMIRLHGGSVNVESKEGEGSRFSFTLPWVDMGEATSAKTLQQQTETGPISEGKRSGKILIVEDTDSIIMLLSEYLKFKGYQILVAHDGVEGVTLAIKEKPDLILMDVMMPVMDGVEATKKIRTEKDLQHIPIIALTALAMPGDKERCLRAGMNDYLSKPVQMKELDSLIMLHIHRSKGKTTPLT